MNNRRGSKLIVLALIVAVFVAVSVNDVMARGMVQRVEYMTNSGEGVIPNLNKVRKMDIGGVKKLTIIESNDAQTRLVSAKGERVVSEFSSNKKELRVVGLDAQELILYCSSAINRLSINIMVDTLDIDIHSKIELDIQGSAAVFANVNMLNRKSNLNFMMFDTPRFRILAHKQTKILLRSNRFTVGPNVLRNFNNVVEYVAAPYMITRY